MLKEEVRVGKSRYSKIERMLARLMGREGLRVRLQGRGLVLVTEEGETKGRLYRKDFSLEEWQVIKNLLPTFYEELLTVARFDGKLKKDDIAWLKSIGIAAFVPEESIIFAAAGRI